MHPNVAKVANVEGEEVGPLGMEEGANLSQPRHRWLFATEVGRTKLPISDEDDQGGQDKKRQEK